MQQIAKFIYKTYTTHLPTVFPVHYFGLPDGKVYLIYGRFYEKGLEESGLEFVLAKHREFYYDYTSERLKAFDPIEDGESIYPEEVDKPDPNIKIIKVYRNIDSYGAAIKKLNKRAAKGNTETTE